MWVGIFNTTTGYHPIFKSQILCLYWEVHVNIFNVIYGVHQGSMLVPIMLSLYMHVLADVSIQCSYKKCLTNICVRLSYNYLQLKSQKTDLAERLLMSQFSRYLFMLHLFNKCSKKQFFMTVCLWLVLAEQATKQPQRIEIEEQHIGWLLSILFLRHRLVHLSVFRKDVQSLPLMSAATFIWFLSTLFYCPILPLKSKKQFGSAWSEEEIRDQKADSVELFV